jgi:hypothetical protein
VRKNLVVTLLRCDISLKGNSLDSIIIAWNFWDVTLIALQLQTIGIMG